MRIIGHGIDIVECERIEKIRADPAERFLTRIFTPAELDYCLDCKTQAVRLSGRFAAKEAILKMLGTGWRGGIAWTDMEILPDGLGKPNVRLSGGCAVEAEKLGIREVLISISHTANYATASAIGVGAD